jgi:hypothetical protein
MRKIALVASRNLRDILFAGDVMFIYGLTGPI